MNGGQPIRMRRSPRLRSVVGLLALLLAPVADQAGEAANPTTATSPWSNYNAAVLAYSRKDYAEALRRWQDLSLQPLPRGLREPVWFQLGNTEFRLGEPLEQEAPEQAVELWRRSCEDYRVVLADQPHATATRHNLELVSSRLARLLHRLGSESFAAAQDKPLDPAINLLRTGTDNLNEAVTLAPADPAIRADLAATDQALRERLFERARQAETQADNSARQTNPWADRDAEESYRAALEDLGDARREPGNRPSARQPNVAPVPPTGFEQSIAQAEERVNQKLADLLTRIGQREQKQGLAQAEWNPDQALDRYQAALDHFQAAQQAQPNHEAARRGEREVRTAMEQLHVREGQYALKQGREELAQRNPQAAPSLTTAQGHFQAALELNEQNTEARAGADEAQRLLPEALALAGQDEMLAGERAERRSVSDALNRYQQAQSDFEQALALKPGQPQAEQGLREVEPKLARMREQMAKESNALAQQNQPSNRRPESLESLLGQVNERERAPQGDRQRQRARRDSNARKNYPDW